MPLNMPCLVSLAFVLLMPSAKLATSVQNGFSAWPGSV